MKTPVFFTKPRNGKISLWVEMDDHDAHNICDLPENLVTEEVLNAIEMSFLRGVSFTMREVNSARIGMTLNKWGRRSA